jgi:hypothetical protein
MLPPLKTVKAGLRVATEALAHELAQARPGNPTPFWNELEWQLAMATAAAHGVSPLLSQFSQWQHAGWQTFLAQQREHVELRHQRVVSLLQQIGRKARSAQIAVVPLKGSALHAMGLYAPGERPMADVDLLVCEADAAKVSVLLCQLGYEESFTQWKHRVFRPVAAEPCFSLGEHRDTPINIELHTHIHERVPVSTIDLTHRIFPCDPKPGLNAYPSLGATMSHLLLHASGNLCHRSARLIHLNDISLLATRMSVQDWNMLWGERGDESAWWAFPTLQLVNRYYRQAIPRAVLDRAEQDCPRWLRTISKHQTLTKLSCSELWLHAVPGLEWSNGLSEAWRYVQRRIRPDAEMIKERADMVRTQAWLQEKNWVTLPQRRRLIMWLTQPIPRMDTLYVVRSALESSALASRH